MNVVSIGGRYATEADPPQAPEGLDHRWLALIPLSLVLLLGLSSALGRRLTWAVNPIAVSMGLIGVADVWSSWSSNNPSFLTTRSATVWGGKDRNDEHVRRDIEIGGAKSAIEVAVLAIGASLLTGSFAPWAIMQAAYVGQWFFFDWALEHPHTEGE